MAWTWINDLLAPENKKKTYWEARCPYMVCPSNQPFRGAHKPRLKFWQRISPMVYEYKCKDCGCHFSTTVEKPDKDRCFDEARWSRNPALWGEKASYKFHV